MFDCVLCTFFFCKIIEFSRKSFTALEIIFHLTFCSLKASECSYNVSLFSEPKSVFEAFITFDSFKIFVLIKKIVLIVDVVICRDV